MADPDPDPEVPAVERDPDRTVTIDGYEDPYGSGIGLRPRLEFTSSAMRVVLSNDIDMEGTRSVVFECSLGDIKRFRYHEDDPLARFEMTARGRMLAPVERNATFASEPPWGSDTETADAVEIEFHVLFRGWSEWIEQRDDLFDLLDAGGLIDPEENLPPDDLETVTRDDFPPGYTFVFAQQSPGMGRWEISAEALRMTDGEDRHIIAECPMWDLDVIRLNSGRANLSATTRGASFDHLHLTDIQAALGFSVQRQHFFHLDDSNLTWERGLRELRRFAHAYNIPFVMNDEPDPPIRERFQPLGWEPSFVPQAEPIEPGPPPEDPTRNRWRITKGRVVFAGALIVVGTILFQFLYYLLSTRDLDSATFAATKAAKTWVSNFVCLGVVAIATWLIVRKARRPSAVSPFSAAPGLVCRSWIPFANGETDDEGRTGKMGRPVVVVSNDSSGYLLVLQMTSQSNRFGTDSTMIPVGVGDWASARDVTEGKASYLKTNEMLRIRTDFVDTSQGPWQLPPGMWDQVAQRLPDRISDRLIYPAA